MNMSSGSNPAELRARLVESAQRLQRGDLPGAAKACDALLRLSPDEPEALHLAGLIAHRRGDLAQARARLEQAVNGQPRMARFHNSLAVVLRDLGEAESARKALEQAIELRPGFAGAYFNLGLVNEDLNDYPGALSAYETACEHDADMAGAHHARGMVLQMLGRLDEARDAFATALEIQPAYPEAQFHLAHARRAESADDRQLARIEALLARHEWPPREAAWLYSALGKLNDDLGRHDPAFEAYQRANRSTEISHDPEARDEWAQRLINAFPSDRLEQDSGAALERADRIFVVGMPRSGTTLLEAMLARHPEVAAGGERMELQAVLTQASESLGLSEPGHWAAAEPDCLRRAATLLDRQLEAPTSASMLVDKLPGNIWRLGLVGLLMPRAPVLFAWRDPRDVGLSCYFTRFRKGQNFSYDLYHCGRQIRTVYRLTEHWLEALPNPVAVVSYEALVDDPEGTLRKAIDSCGLDQSDMTRDHTLEQEVVTTASSWQVRQGVYRRAVNRWRHYRQHLGPLLQGLGSTTLNGPPGR